ncbi:transcriptional regulator [Helicobacter muridarum]|uniref:Transcriptional regulator n=1 Tax=Helicobacter muridarum TaxID=216 RepID=A0A4U8TL47_9HELI|nr:transcriptional regulator [Helicobacter muridarum]
MDKKSDNLIKKTCKELGLTYRELGEKIGYSEEAISKAARTDKISIPMQKACEMFLKIKELEEEKNLLDELTSILQKLTTRT